MFGAIRPFTNNQVNQCNQVTSVIKSSQDSVINSSQDSVIKSRVVKEVRSYLYHVSCHLFVSCMPFLKRGISYLPPCHNRVHASCCIPTMYSSSHHFLLRHRRVLCC